MTASLATTVLLGLFSALLLAGAVQDVISLRISNAISVAVLAVATAALALNPGPSWWEHPLSFALALCLGIALFSLRWLGGGDAKLMAGAAMAFDMGGLIRFVPSVFMVGGLLAIVAIAVRMTMRGRPKRDSRGLPYGVAIAAGAAVAAWFFPSHTVFGR